MSLHGEMLTYGVLKSDGILYHIDDKSVKNGSKCDCLCPKCHTSLIARRGDVNEHHFAHANGDKCPGAQMSALHKLAQQILAEGKRVMLPEYSKTYVQHQAKLQVFDSITLEEVCQDEVSRRRPDCVGKPYCNSSSLWIEIYCCNPIKVNGEREKDIIRRNQHCIEIDFSDLMQTDYKPDDVKDRLLNSCTNRRWVCHPEWDKEERQKEDEATKLEWEERKREMEESMRQVEEEKRKQEELLQKQKHITVSNFSFIRRIESENKTQSNGKRDWVMFAKEKYVDKNGRETFYKTLIKEYTKVTLENSRQMVAKEACSKINDLLPRTHLIFDVTKIYLEMLLAIWVLDKLNHSEVPDLSRVFIVNQSLRNNTYKAIKKIGNINNREIEETLIPAELENRDIILHILRICYAK
ncbi:MAG: hypothetical protein J6T80_07210 [Paludibacteraceae bacterium]|nr:hypothetical protein [Paludibacteraceae bacterium]